MSFLFILYTSGRYVSNNSTGWLTKHENMTRHAICNESARFSPIEPTLYIYFTYIFIFISPTLYIYLYIFHVREIERQLSSVSASGGHFSPDRSSFEFFFAARESGVKIARPIVYFKIARLDRDIQDKGRSPCFAARKLWTRNFAPRNRMRLVAAVAFRRQCLFQSDAGSSFERWLASCCPAGDCFIAKIRSFWERSLVLVAQIFTNIHSISSPNHPSGKISWNRMRFKVDEVSANFKLFISSLSSVLVLRSTSGLSSKLGEMNY